MAKPKPKLKKDKKPPGKRKLPRDKAQMRLKRDGGNPDWKTTELGGLLDVATDDEYLRRLRRTRREMYGLDPDSRKPWR
jgi:hypothetical protein